MGKNTVVDNFENLPFRIFLDSNILQYLQEYGEYIWDNVETQLPEKEVRNIEALRNIFSFDFRTSFEFAISKNSIKEVLKRKDISYLHWAFDVLDYWESCIEMYKNSEAFTGEGEMLLKRLDENQFDYLSKKDKLLLFDAVVLESHAFLTMDIKFCKNKNHLEKRLEIKVLQPFEYWEMLKPFAALWI